MNPLKSAAFAVVLGLALTACGPSSTDDSSDGGSAPSGPTDPGSGGNATGTIDPTTGFLTTSAPIEHTVFSDGSNIVSLSLANGTVANSANITVNGRSRRYLVIRPDPAPANAPVLLLLHSIATSPEDMANIAEVSDYVLTQRFIAVMPAGLNGSWDQDPAGARNEDVPFISALIDSLIANNGVDGTRVYAAGFSDGGFMTERLACQLSDKIAAFSITSATLRGTLASICDAPARLRSKIYFLGTADAVVPYNGIFSDAPTGLRSAAATLAFWNAQQGCGDVVANTLPDLANDGTTVLQTQYTGCSAGTALQLYTINNGGHAWPGGAPTFTGLTSQDIQATGLTWRFVSGARR